MTMYGIDIDLDYFDWLCDVAHIEIGDEIGYTRLAKDLHSKQFYSLIEHDENRASDGIELRREYVIETGLPREACIKGECSVLEMLIGLARRIDFETSDPYDDNDISDRTAYWFWELIENLGLISFDDASYNEYGGAIFVDKIIDRLLERRYSKDGRGGLFPLKNSKVDQRDVEIWYQMAAYLNEKEGENVRN